MVERGLSIDGRRNPEAIENEVGVDGIGRGCFAVQWWWRCY